MVLHANIQAQDCGTVVTPEQELFMSRMGMNTNVRLANFGVEIPIVAHIVRRDDGSGGLPISQLQHEIDRVNELYVSVDMQFTIQEVNFVNSTEYYNFDSRFEDQFAFNKDVGGVINIYFFGSISAGSSALCGYTRFPPSADRVFMSNSCSTNGSTLAHELGHYFTLYHTHGKTNTGTTDELVDRSNCVSAGDEICDTPADPNLSGKVGAGCVYTGNSTDANGAFFTPFVNNIMSYAPSSCRTSFTNGQYQRIRLGFENGRSYLNFTTSNFVAAFSTQSNTTQCIPAILKFESKTPGATRYEWVFPGGTPSSSNKAEPEVIYTQPGRYNVQLTIYNANNQSSTITRQNIVNVQDPLSLAINEDIEEIVDESEISSPWKLVNPDAAITFDVANVSATDDGSNSFYINNYNYRTEGLYDEDLLLSPNYDLRGASSVNISFDYAYTYYRPNEQLSSYDTLRVIAQDDCSGRNLLIWKKGGAGLATVTPIGESPFIPSEGDWRNVKLTYQLDGSNSVLAFGFLNKTGHGNNLYIDNIKIKPDYFLDAPQNFKASVFNGNVSLTWTKPTRLGSGIIVQRRILGEDNFTNIDTLSNSNVFYTDRNVPLGISMLEYRIANYSPNFISDFSDITTINNPLSTEQDYGGSVSNYTIFPNPVTHKKFSIVLPDNIKLAKIQVVDISGRVVANRILTNKSNELVLNLSSGLYMLHIIDSIGNKTIKILYE